MFGGLVAKVSMSGVPFIMVVSQDLKILRERYVSSLLLGDAGKAKQAVIDAQSRGLDVHVVYVDILAYSQSVLGAMWDKGEINIAVEHLATVVALEIMNELRTQASQMRKSNGLRAVVTPVEGDTHTVGSRMLSDFLIIDGWEVDFMGGPTPGKDLVEFVKIRSVDMVCISVTMPTYINNAKSTIEALKLINPSPKILIGGLALNSSEIELNSLNCDAVGLNSFEGVTEARRLFGIADGDFTLEEHLSDLGSRIRTTRLEKRMTQQDLANASELDRTYISALEQGKQNVTFGAVLRIAKALDLSLKPGGRWFNPDNPDQESRL
jgi:methanogenic corrinoid protein MtbC1/DNA-binding XRE family transcriptional regulator